MSIPYTYEIVNVNPDARAMEVIYRADGHQTVHIGTRLPYKGESLESVIRMYEPINFWLEQQAEVFIPILGQTGNITPKKVLIDNETQPSAEIRVTVLG